MPLSRWCQVAIFVVVSLAWGMDSGNCLGQVKFLRPDIPREQMPSKPPVATAARMQDDLQPIRRNGISSTPLVKSPYSNNELPSLQPNLIAPTSIPSTELAPPDSNSKFGDNGFLAVDLGRRGSTNRRQESAPQQDPADTSNRESVLKPSRPPLESLPVPISDPSEFDTEGLEEIRQNFPDGRPRIIRYVLQDEEGNYYNHGPWKVFSRAQQQEIVASGVYRHGRMQGQWRRQHDANSGGLFKTKPFDMYQGPFLSVANFDDGKLDGIWSIYDAYQRNIFEIRYKDGVRHGTATWWFPNRTKMRETTFKNGLLDGQILAWDESEKLIRREEFIEGRRVVRNTTYYPSKQKQSEDHFLESKLVPEGEDDWWGAKPTPYLSAGDKIQDGMTMKWYENNQPKEKGQYKDGVRVGQFTWWHPNGNKQIEGLFIDGKKSRLWTWWYANGMKRIEGEYENDQPTGQWRSWHENGELRKEQSFSPETKPARQTDDSPSNDSVLINSPESDPASHDSGPDTTPKSPESLPVPPKDGNNAPNETSIKDFQMEDLEGIEPLNQKPSQNAADGTDGNTPPAANEKPKNDGSLPEEIFKR